YYTWCKANDFQSKLPADVKACETSAAAVSAKQGTLDGHVKKIEPRSRTSQIRCGFQRSIKSGMNGHLVYE
ncbi:hypothetical protein PAXRUDRAFT_181989, partial [Paxillus rubicundulus Ve08.2h10]